MQIVFLLDPTPLLQMPDATTEPFVVLGRARVPISRLGGGPQASAQLTVASPRWDTNPLLRFGTFGRAIGMADVPLRPERTATSRPLTESRMVTEYTDLGFEVRGSGQIGGDWTRFRPCDATVQVTCEPSALPQLRPDLQFGVRADGSFTDRMYIEVDYDQTREFAGANQVNFQYRGLEGEFLQRLDVGDVFFVDVA